MNPTGLVKYAGALVALAICSACGGGSAVTPSSAALNGTYVGRMLFVNGRPVTAARLSATPRYTQIMPAKHSKSKDFEYVFGDYGSYAAIFDYPKSTRQIGEIAGDGGQGCTNVLYGYCLLYTSVRTWLTSGVPGTQALWPPRARPVNVEPIGDSPTAS